MSSDKFAKLVSTLREAMPERPMTLINARVKEITGDSCTVVYGSLELTKVRLCATIGNGVKLLLEPKVNTMVLLGSLTGDLKDLAVLRADELAAVKIEVEREVVLKTPDFKVDADQTTFNGGTNGGMLKIEPTVAELNKMQDDLNMLKSLIGSWTPVPADGGAALKTALLSWAATSIVRTSVGVLENPKIKH